MAVSLTARPHHLHTTNCIGSVDGTDPYILMSKKYVMKETSVVQVGTFSG